MLENCPDESRPLRHPSPLRGFGSAGHSKLNSNSRSSTRRMSRRSLAKADHAAWNLQRSANVRLHPSKSLKSKSFLRRLHEKFKCAFRKAQRRWGRRHKAKSSLANKECNLFLRSKQGRNFRTLPKIGIWTSVQQNAFLITQLGDYLRNEEWPRARDCVF